MTTPPGQTPEWHFRLYIAGESPRSAAALANLKAICEANFAGKYQIEVIDLLVNPKLATEDQILAIPTLVRILPAPARKVIGDLFDTKQTLIGLELRAAKEEP